LFGGVGNDHLDGGDGDDYLNGGVGNDIYIASAGTDTIAMFEDNVDTIDMWGVAFATASDAIAFVDNYGAIVGNDAVFSYAGQTLIVTGVTDLTIFYDDVI
jgi:serralysin